MVHRGVFPVLLLLASGLGGCVADDVVGGIRTAFGDGGSRVAATEAAVTPATLSGPNSIPWQLTPASAASVSQGEMTLVVEKQGYGRIRGTDRALAQLDQRLVAFSEGGRVVSACKDAFDSQARAAGAYSIEAAAAGPERRSAKGRSQQVFFRIFYPDTKDDGVEVRQASIACTLDRKGQLVQATPV